jgi:hypothetical protein
MSVPFSQLGNHHIVMSYSGDANYNPVSQDLGTLVVVDKIPTSVNFLPPVNLPANSPIFLSASIGSGNTSGPVMGGTVTFQDGGTTIPGNVQYSFQTGYMDAAVQYPFPSPGMHTVTVQYSGDSIYAATSQTFQVRILGPLALEFPGGLINPTYIASALAGTANIQLDVANSTNASMSVVLTCTSVSATATCAVNPSSATLSPFGGSLITVTINGPKVTASVRPRYPFTLAFVFAGVLAGVPLRRRKKQLLIMAALMAFAISLASCGGGGGSGSGTNGSGGTTGTPSGKTYSFTVTATSGANTDTEGFSVSFE